MQTPEKYIPGTIDKVNIGEKVIIHANPECTKAGSRFYIHGDDFADALYFLITKQPEVEVDYGGAKTKMFNIVGKDEVDNLTLANMIAQCQGKELIYQLVDHHSSRPGHDTRYSLDGSLMESLGWKPTISLIERIQQVTDWYLENPRWLGR